jgi:hypothetical protein
MIVAHIAGVPVEELGQPVLIALMLSGAWLSTRVRRRHHPIHNDPIRNERSSPDGE